jgi:hypothetical protein
MPNNTFSAIFRCCAALLAVAIGTGTAAAEPYISEFMASNTATLRDEDGAYSDWLELHNPTPVAVDLTGWYLTDTASNLRRWQFPSITIPAEGFLVVFASNKNRREPGRELHTNFALAAEGEYLALVQPDGATVVSEYAPTFPRQSADVSYGLVRENGGLVAAYFTTPTPGAPNIRAGAILLTETVEFSRPSGPFVAPFTLELMGAGPGQHIRYMAVSPSWAGATVPEPTAHSPVYDGPLAIDGPIIVRAAIFSDDLRMRSRSTAAHYFRIDLSGPLGLGSFATQLPVLVIDQHGLSALAKPDGERPAWMYGYHPRGGMPVFAGLPDFGTPVRHKVRGWSSADFPKSSYNVELVDHQGQKTTRTLFGALEFDEWALVGPWLYDRSLIRNSYVYALSNSIGRWAPRTEPVEVFVNAHGTPLDTTSYAGVYVLTDKVEIVRDRVNIVRMPAGATAASDITGGYLLKLDHADPNEYSFTTNRLLEDYSSSVVVVASPKADKLSPAQRNYIRGYVEAMEWALETDQASGWATRMYLDYIDRPSWVDHHILNTFAANPDGLERSAYFTKDRGGRLVAGPVWDFDRALGSPADGRSDRWDVWYGENAVQVWHFGWWGMIARDPEFMQEWVDRWQSLRRSQFADGNLTALADQLAAAIGPQAAARDAAQWLDNLSPLGSHAAEIAYLKDWLVRRARWIDSQFVARPVVRSSGGMLEVVAAAGAELVYTLDGSDPRALGGDLAPNAIVSSGPVRVPPSANLQARSYRADMLHVFPGSPWSAAAGGPMSTPLSPKSRLVNLSSRAVVGSGENALIAGVVIADTGRKEYLGRGIGPGLAVFGAADTVPDPQISIFNGEGVELFRNSRWNEALNAAELPRLFGRVGAFPLPDGSNDAALAFDLPAGAYSVQITTPSGQPGVGLAELYELDASGRTINLSTRAHVGADDRVLIGGFVVHGVAHKRMLIRAVGPTLRAFGVENALLDPVLTVYSGPEVVESNSRWYGNDDTTAVAAASARVGAFGLAANSDDAALLITLAPGAYTVEVRGADGGEGVALLEIYEVP